MKNYYSILGVSKTATLKDIKKTFKKLAVKHHPDKNPDDAAAAKKMVELNEAYAVIGNEKLRKEYDTSRKQQAAYKKQQAEDRQPKNEHSGASSSEPYKATHPFSKEYQFEDFSDFMNRGFEDLGEDLFNIFGIYTKAEDLFSEIYLTPSEARYGARKQFVFQKPGLCTSCYGNSLHSDFIDCDDCKNQGKILVNKKLWVTIPPQVPNKGRIRLRKQGSSGDGHTDPGDLIITINITQDGREPHNAILDIHLSMSISIDLAIYGGPLVIQTGSGTKKIQVPKEIYPGKKIRVRKEGTVDQANGQAGHIYIIFDVEIPNDPTRTEKNYIEKMNSKTK